MRVPTSLRFTVPLILLGFAATLSTVNLLYHVPQAEREAEEEGRKRLAQEMSRLQSTLEYLMLKGDTVAASHEIAVLAHNHDVLIAASPDGYLQPADLSARHCQLFVVDLLYLLIAQSNFDRTTRFLAASGAAVAPRRRPMRGSALPNTAARRATAQT